MQFTDIDECVSGESLNFIGLFDVADEKAGLIVPYAPLVPREVRHSEK
jgi:hypothetical protein